MLRQPSLITLQLSLSFSGHPRNNNCPPVFSSQSPFHVKDRPAVLNGAASIRLRKMNMRIGLKACAVDTIGGAMRLMLRAKASVSKWPSGSGRISLAIHLP
jgi:hypothetical protein